MTVAIHSSIPGLTFSLTAESLRLVLTYLGPLSALLLSLALIDSSLSLCCYRL